MRKIGIVTLFGYNNYGNRLQMYAVQQIYHHLGYSSEIIKYREETVNDPLIIRFKVFANKLLSLRTTLVQSFLKRLRIRQFKKHAHLHYMESPTYINPLNVDKSFHEKYDFFSVGSDQIWGWFSHVIADFVFLKFAPPSKRITFSPSFGSATIDDKYRNVFSEGLRGFKNISIREESGIDIIKDFTNKDATVLCDPTMFLSKEEWVAFSTVHKSKPKMKYVLTYFLGEMPPKAREVLAQISKEYDIVHLNSFKAPDFYTINPSEWVDYINDASLFLSDSFHGVVFSLVLQTPFAVYGRVGGEEMQTRLTHILDKFKMQDRFEISMVTSSLFSMDFSNTEVQIGKEKSKAYSFLEISLRP